MILKKDSYGYFDHGWLKTYHHFSFGDYYNPEKMNFGVLRVLNDDIIKGNSGFPKHPHRDMEILTYVLEGKLSHQDSMGHEKTVTRGDIQYMSAGTGVYHSEYNHEEEDIRLLQIWIYPDQKGYAPNYGDASFNWSDRVNKWLHLVGQEGVIQMHQDVNIYVSYLEDKTLDFELKEGRQAYLIQMEGQSIINQETLNEKEAMTFDSQVISIQGNQSHIMIIEMKKE